MIPRDEFDVEDLLTFTIQITREVGRYILDVIENGEIHTYFKTSPTDLVTQVDREVERRLISLIKEQYPDHSILGEEGVEEVKKGGEITWIIDPIDGTTNFVHQRINFCTSVGVYRGNEGLVGIIFDPVRDEMFWGAKGKGSFLNGDPLRLNGAPTLGKSLLGTNMLWVRRTKKWGLEQQVQELAQHCRGIRALGAAALEMAYVAAGRLQGYLSLHLSPWDFAAGKLIIEEAGGIVRDFQGNPILLSQEKMGLIAVHPHIFSEIIEIVKMR